MIRKALTFRASSIGDCLMGKYLLDNIRAQYPEARLGIVLGGRAAMIRDLLADYPYIEVVEANRKSPASLWRLWQGWQGSDLVVTQYGGKVGGSFSLASKFAARLLAKRGGLAGFTDASAWNAFLYDVLVKDPNAHSPAENERRALRAVGLAVPLPYPSLETPVAPRSSGSRRYVVVNLFSSTPKRGLSPDNRRTLVAALRALLPRDVELLLTGSVADRPAALEAAQDVARVVAGESWHDTIALVAGSLCVVSLDTGIAHIAAQLRKPIVVLSTCMGVAWWTTEQYGDGTFKFFTAALHTIAGHRFEDYPDCLNKVDMRQVAAAALPYV